MKTASIFIILSTLFIIVSCSSDRDKAKAEILQTEKDFERLVAGKGLAFAFSFYAADSAVINVRDHLLKGKEDIRKHYVKWETEDVSLRWTPDFIDVAASGDLGYTFGRYIFEVTDSTGKVTQSKGVFHTVWKKQSDGTWRFVWD